MERLRTDICVIGAGSGGLSVAAGAVQMGARGEVDGETWVAVQGVADGARVLRGAAGVLREGTQVKLASPAAPAAAASTAQNGARP